MGETKTCFDSAVSVCLLLAPGGRTKFSVGRESGHGVKKNTQPLSCSREEPSLVKVWSRGGSLVSGEGVPPNVQSGPWRRG